MNHELDICRRLLELLCPRTYALLVERDGIQLLFAFRWLLLDFKREFPLSDVAMIWETMWVDYHTKHFNCFIVCAMADRILQEVPATCTQMDQVPSSSRS